MKEEPKQETIKEPCVQCCGTGEIQKSTNRKQSNFECDLCDGKGHWNKVIEPKQETLEEVAKEFFRKFKHTHSPDNYYLALVEFAKWQSERSYSEEDLKEAFFEGWIARDGKLTFSKAKNKWFKELKTNKI